MPQSNQQRLYVGLLLLFRIALASEIAEGTERELQMAQCFQTTQELRQAVRDFVYGDANTRAVVTSTYGSAMGNWCVDELQDFSSIFYGMRSFNEDISNWKTMK